MTMVLIVVAVVSGALVLGAAWGIYGSLSTKTEGFLVALAGGALLLSVVTELIEPSVEETSLLAAVIGVAIGAIVFSVVDYAIKEKMDSSGGAGLLAAITLDGIPENLALGVALIGAGAPEVAALAGSILLSNLPEAAGGAKDMASGRSKGRVLALWAATAAILSLAAVAGNVFLAEASDTTLGTIRCIAAGAVIASLATEVFPKAYRENDYWTGIATALGVLLALALGELGGG
ncbi:ZIP family metal transporter [Aurantiacibacter poecillastricola]|uniref:ZIP family metal transporter n=1 Tax=Aurantiacibacter poecillastricola TaxID=3064385 RepID=UPI00273FA40A|nr:zinc transporter [Aurantiacibacter sp. 219JJ12-13]MDP5260798.1 zinc transporter [Aurantiacibacter sp. 219JJ12-13]